MTGLAIGGIAPETASFLPGETTLRDLERSTVRGDEIGPAFAGSNTVSGGFLKIRQDNDVGIEGLLCTEWAPSGPVSAAAFQSLADQLVSRATPWRAQADGLLLHPHGAMVARGDHDPEPSLLARPRKAQGDD